MSKRKYDYDLIVIGGGSGGVRSARWAAALGAKVAICEEERFGGTCVLRGCVPKKMMVYGSHFADDIITSRDYGWDIEIKSHNWQEFQEKREKELSRLSGLYEKMLSSKDVTLLKGKGSFEDQHTIRVGDQLVTSENIIIAVGGRPWNPEFEGSEHTINSNQFFDLKKRPQRVVINGGGFIGVEFACLLKNFSSEVHIIIRKDTILRGFDTECATYLQEQMKAKGIHFHTSQNIKKVKKNADGSQLVITESQSIETDAVIMATGRVPYIEGLNLNAVGIETMKSGAITVNEYSQTNVENVFAVGDVTNRMNLTPVALQEGMQVAENLYGARSDWAMTYDNIPSAVFSQPPLATVGLTEEEANQQGLNFEIYSSEFRPLKYTLGERQKRSLMKMIVEKDSRKVLGLHMVGDDSAEIIQGFAVALKAGATKEIFDQTIGVHPTSAEEFVTMREPRLR